MKRVLLTMTIIVCLCLLMTGADFRPAQHSTDEIKIRKTCIGYTIIEAGKGIDCYGDTIKLVKRHGFYELVSYNER